MPTDSFLVELLTIAELAKMLKISVMSVRRLQGARIPFLKVGGSVRFLKRDILAYLENQRVVPIGQ